MDCSTLERLIESHEPVELIDIRSTSQFREAHIPGARSVPFPQLANPKRFCRWRPTLENVYVVSDDCVKASLATGILRSRGYANAAVVKGGIDAWTAQRLPVSSGRITPKLPSFLNAGSMLLGVVAACAVVFGKFLIASLVLVSAIALLIKAMLVTRPALPSAQLRAC